MAEGLFIKHKFVDTTPENPESGAIYFERETGIIQAIESESKKVIVGDPRLSLNMDKGEGLNSIIANDTNNTATGENAFAEGSNTDATGQCSHAEGSSTQAIGEFTHAEGYNTVANGKYSHTEGYSTETKNEAEHAQGKWNISDDTLGNNTIDTVGYGTGPEDRKNLYELREDGSAYFIGIGDYDGTNASTADSIQDVLNDTVQKVVDMDPSLYQTKEDNTLNTTSKIVSGAINELLSNSQTKTDNSLNTTSKTVSGAINELLTTKQNNITAGIGLELVDNTLNVILDTEVFKVVQVLPAQPAEGDENKIHLVPSTTSGTQNIYTEYVYANNNWEILGEYDAHVDLTPYLTKAEAAGTYQPIGSYQTKLIAGENIKIEGSTISVDEDFNLYQTKTDNTLQTTDKTIVGAINEVNNQIFDQLEVSTLFLETPTVTSEIATLISTYGTNTAKKFPLMYAHNIGNFIPTWINTIDTITYMMCIANNKIYYFEITTGSSPAVQRTEIGLS